MNLQLLVDAGVVGAFEGVQDIGTVRHSVGYQPSVNFQEGVGAGQANKMWADTRTIAASGTDDLDLNGVLKDAVGGNFDLTKIKAVLIKAAGSNVNDVLVGGAAANQAASMFGAVTDKVRVKPGGFVLLCAPDANGYAVTAGTADILRIANSAAGTPVTFDIVIIGV